MRDNDGQVSNPATVNITVNNVAPNIENIILPDTIIEGTEIKIKAIAICEACLFAFNPEIDTLALPSYIVVCE